MSARPVAECEATCRAFAWHEQVLVVVKQRDAALADLRGSAEVIASLQGCWNESEKQRRAALADLEAAREALRYLRKACDVYESAADTDEGYEYWAGAKRHADRLLRGAVQP